MLIFRLFFCFFPCISQWQINKPKLKLIFPLTKSVLTQRSRNAN